MKNDSRVSEEKNSPVYRRFSADLHVHTCLSPCGDWEMSPRKIVRAALAKNLDIIGICDHNSVLNVEAVIKAGREVGLFVLPGIEVCSREEVHILGIFNDINDAWAMQAYVNENLEGQNNPDLWGCQVIASEDDQVVGEENKLLIGATRLGVYEIIKGIHRENGIAIASHIDRPSFGIISQLGFIPDDLLLDAVEVSSRTSPAQAVEKLIPGSRYTCITSSDAHFLKDLGKVRTFFSILNPDFQEIRLALGNRKGRKTEV